MEENDVRVEEKSAVVEQNHLTNDLHLVGHFEVELVGTEKGFRTGEVLWKKRLEIGDWIALLRENLVF